MLSTDGVSLTAPVPPGMAKGKLMRVEKDSLVAISVLVDVDVVADVDAAMEDVVLSARASARVALALSVPRKKILPSIMMLAASPIHWAFPLVRLRGVSLPGASVGDADL